MVIGGDYITTESGTGLVHTAPGHGQEDYQTGLKYDLPLYSPVDDAGNFTEDAGGAPPTTPMPQLGLLAPLRPRQLVRCRGAVGHVCRQRAGCVVPERLTGARAALHTEAFVGKNVLGEGNTAVIDALTTSGALLKEEEYAHKYPYDWRTKKPTIFRATAQVSSHLRIVRRCCHRRVTVPFEANARSGLSVPSSGRVCVCDSGLRPWTGSGARRCRRLGEWSGRRRWERTASPP